MNLKKCRQILNAIALLVVIIVFASNIPLFNSIHKEMIYVSIFLIIIDIMSNPHPIEPPVRTS